VNYDALLGHIETLHGLTTGRAAAAVNQALLVRNWLMGAWIIEFEQFGADRATDGSGLLKRLAKDLKAAGLRGVSPDLLERMQGFYKVYPQLWPAISATASRNSFSLLGSTEVAMASEISATVSRKSSGQELPPLPAEAVFRPVALPAPEDLQRLVEADRALLEQLPDDDKEPQ
jgi:hypothetical protein